MRAWWVGEVSILSPKGMGFTDPLPEPPALPPHLEPPRGLEPRSTRYQRVALPLSYGGGMAEWRKVEASNLCPSPDTTV